MSHGTMTALSGIALATGFFLATLTAGYLVAGLMRGLDLLTRLALASLTGLAVIILGASVLGAFRPLDTVAVILIAGPILIVWLVPATRRQWIQDARTLVSKPAFYAAAAGLLLLLACLWLPFGLYPDLAFFDGKTNHDNFFWSVGGEFLQHHSYLTAVSKDRDHPLFTAAEAIVGWKPAWGRMGAEGFLAVAGSSVGRSPVMIYNFVVSALVPVWLLTVLAVARRTGLPALNRFALAFVCFCQPVLFFFIANGNLPNLLGALFGGGLWLLILLRVESKSHAPWPALVAGILFTHALLCSYPEMAPFAFLPVGLLAAWQGVRSSSHRFSPALGLAGFLAGGLCLNPLTTVRAWHGFWTSVHSARLDSTWANVFAPLDPLGYAPGFITLATPSLRLLGFAGGALASFCVLLGFSTLLQRSPRTVTILISLSGFFALLAYTLATSFDYGWQKSVQFGAVPLAVCFPVLIAGLVQNPVAHPRAGWLRQLGLIGTLVVMVYGLIGNTTELVKSAGTKGLTTELLSLRDRLARDLPGQPIVVDGATFRAAFFHSMWSARLFANHPVTYLPRETQPGGYLKDQVVLANPAQPFPHALYYVGADWARAFDYEPESLMHDRVGALIRQHNAVTEMHGFYRVTGVPEWAEASFALAIQPYADGWLEFALVPNGAAGPGCRLRGSAATEAGLTPVEATLNAQKKLVVRFPLKAGTMNRLNATIIGAPAVDPENEQTRFPFRVERVESGRLSAR